MVKVRVRLMLAPPATQTTGELGLTRVMVYFLGKIFGRMEAEAQPTRTAAGILCKFFLEIFGSFHLPPGGSLPEWRQGLRSQRDRHRDGRRLRPVQGAAQLLHDARGARKSESQGQGMLNVARERSYRLYFCQIRILTEFVGILSEFSQNSS